jgi:hypothetical protein
MDKSIQAEIIFNKWQQKKDKDVQYIFSFFYKNKIPYSIAKDYVKEVFNVFVKVIDYGQDKTRRDKIAKDIVITAFKSIYKNKDTFEFAKKKEEQMQDYLATFKTVF